MRMNKLIGKEINNYHLSTVKYRNNTNANDDDDNKDNDNSNY